MTLAEAILVPVVMAAVLIAMITLMRTSPITRFGGLTRLNDWTETTTPYHQVGFVVLGLVAVGDAFDAVESIGSPWGIAVLLGVMTGLVGHYTFRRCMFLVIGVIAVATSLPAMFAVDGPLLVRTVLVLGTLGIAVLIGCLLPGGRSPDVLLAKLCALVVLTRFAVEPFDLGVPTGPVPLAVVAVFGGLLLALPGSGVALLLGIAVGLPSLWFGVRSGVALEFVVVFCLFWAMAAWLRARFVGGRSRYGRSAGRS